MNSNAIANSDQQIGRPLHVLVPLILEDLAHAKDAARRAAMPYYEAAGAKMLEAKPKIAGGYAGFTRWLTDSFGISYRNAKRWMDYAEKGGARATYPSIREFERDTEGHARTGKTTWHEPVTKIIDRIDTTTLNLKREELKRADEREAERELGLQLIDIGYKVLAKTLHPDKGGSRQAMARLNSVRDRLRKHV